MSPKLGARRIFVLIDQPGVFVPVTELAMEMQEALNAFRASALAEENADFSVFAPSAKLSTKLQSSPNDCATETANDYEVDVNCLFGFGIFTNCSSAEGTYSYLNENDIESITHDNFTFICSDGSFENCDTIATIENNISCIEGVCTINEQAQNPNYCYQNTDALIRLNKKGYVLNTVTVDDTCDTLCSDWTDVNGSGKIECDVSEKFDSLCPSDTAGITSVSNCQFSADESC